MGAVTHLNLGCANRHLPPPFTNVDIVEPADVLADLSGPQLGDGRLGWLWPDSSVDAIQADDILEHLEDKIFVMNEAWRVLRNGGVFDITVPSALGAGAWQDPTHKSYWVRNSFQYYEAGSFATGRLANAYRIKARFRIEKLEEKDYKDAYETVPKIHAVLVAVK